MTIFWSYLMCNSFFAADDVNDPYYINCHNKAQNNKQLHNFCVIWWQKSQKNLLVDIFARKIDVKNERKECQLFWRKKSSQYLQRICNGRKKCFTYSLPLLIQLPYHHFPTNYYLLIPISHYLENGRKNKKKNFTKTWPFFPDVTVFDERRRQRS